MGEVGDMEKVLKRYTSKDWSKRNKGEVWTTRLPPKWFSELSKAVTETITIWKLIVDRREVDIALGIGGVIEIAFN